MADTLSVEVKASVSWLFSDTLDLSTVIDNARVEYGRSLSDGVGADQADKIWHDTRSLASGAHDDLNLGALAQSLFGGTVTIALAKVKLIVVIHRGTAAGEKLVVGGATSQAFAAPFGGSATGQVEVGPDSLLVLSQRKDGWAVGAGTADLLRIGNPASAAPVTYSVVIVGTSS